VTAGQEPLVSVENLSVEFHTDAGVVKAVDGVSWSISPGETLGIVGESGSGKSVSALALMGLLQKPQARISGRILFRGRDLLTAGEQELRSLRGNDISMIFQDPLSALNPVFKVGHQVAEVIQAHEKMGRVPARRRAVELLDEVGIPNARQRAQEYPHQYSGGMRQRAMIAMALALNPALLLADEPTTALDVTVQAQILDLLADLQARSAMAMLLVSHDLRVVRSRSHRIAVMYAGRIVETAPTPTLFAAPRMPYTEALMNAVPPVAGPNHVRLQVIPGRPPDLLHPPAGCRFAPRCPYAQDRCLTEEPQLRPAESADHTFRCWYPVGSPEWARARARNVERGTSAAGTPVTKEMVLT
jgi:peptide/nickel transport system ATP-binding protein